MRLGLNLGYSGSPLGIDLSLVQEADRLGFHSVWSAEAYGSDAVTPICWVAAQTEPHQGRHRDHADPGAHAGADGDDRDDARPALRRPLPPGLGRVGPAGRRGLARRAVRQAAGADARVRGDRPGGLAARAAGRAPRASTTRSRTRAPTRPGSASRSSPSCTAAPTSRSTSPRSARRTWRWPPRSPTGGCPCSSRPSACRCRPRVARRRASRRRRRQVARALRRRAHGARRARRRRPGLPRRRQAAARAVRRRHGRARRRTSTTIWSRRYGYEDAAERDPGPLPRGQEGRGRGRGAGRARRRGRAVRAAGADPRAAARAGRARASPR